MISLVCRTEVEKKLGPVSMESWNFAITEFGNELNMKYRRTPSKEEQLDKLSTYIDFFNRNVR